MAASSYFKVCILVAIFALPKCNLLLRWANVVHKDSYFTDLYGLNEDGSAVRSYGDFFVQRFCVNFQCINLERKFRVPVSVNKYTKHGSTCLILCSKHCKMDLSVHVDVAINPGPYNPQVKSIQARNYLRVCCEITCEYAVYQHAWLTHRLMRRLLILSSNYLLADHVYRFLKHFLCH